MAAAARGVNGARSACSGDTVELGRCIQRFDAAKAERPRERSIVDRTAGAASFEIGDVGDQENDGRLPSRACLVHE
jgi:hypothetical protein